MLFRRRTRSIEGDSLEELLESAGLADRIEVLKDEELPAVWLDAASAGDADITVGDSKLGGAPDMEEGVPWPMNGDRPLMFLAQVRLADVAALPGADALPASGHLLFFYDEDQPWGFSPEHAVGWKVIHVDSAAVYRCDTPAGAPRLPVCRVTPRPKSTIPDILSMEVEELVLSNAEADDYVEMTEVYAGRYPGPEHQMLGHPVLVQEDMRWECALVAHGFDCGDATAYQTPEAEALLSEIGAWRLLLQLDSDERAGMTWGDAGLLYFWIHEDDLAAGDFSKVRVILQCT